MRPAARRGRAPRNAPRTPCRRTRRSARATRYTSWCPASATELELRVLDRIHVIGSGRARSAIAARLRERRLTVGPADPALVLPCPPHPPLAHPPPPLHPDP